MRMTNSIGRFGVSRRRRPVRRACQRWYREESMQRSILIVEDNDDAREALRMLLELDGHAVEAAAEGIQALEIVRAKDPDVALVDIGLPGIDGYEVARRARAADGKRPLLIALTGYGQPEDRRRASE